MGSETLYKEVISLPSALLQTLSIFREDPVSLVDKLAVKCSFENLLVHGRYLKLSREVSQSPWSVKE